MATLVRLALPPPPHPSSSNSEECHTTAILDRPIRSLTALPSNHIWPAPSPAGQQAMTSYYPDANAFPSATSQHQQHVQSQQQQQSIAYQGFDPDHTELDVHQTASSALSSGAPLSTPLSRYPSLTPSVGTHSAAPFPHPSIADYSSLLPGAAPLESGPNASLVMQQGVALAPMNGQTRNWGAVCAPTALLLSGPSAGNTPDSTPASSRVASPNRGGSRGLGHRAHAEASSSSSGSGDESYVSGSGNRAAQTARASTTLSRPASSLLLGPKSSYNNSYRQANGQKYRKTHGPYNPALPEHLEHFQELLASKRSEKAAASGGEGGEVTLSDADLREVEKAAGPYACEVAECQRRHGNMIGLRYHHRSSGDHGAIGLALLASGQHECLQHNKSRHATPAPSNSNSVPSTPRTYSRVASQLSSPSLSQQHAQSQTQPQYVAPQQQHPPTYQSALTSPPAYSYHHQPSTYALQLFMPQQQQP
ncbi:hypothetical protein LXA43DRAFT_901670 [Ganoderma leucocontextum]|nr:hypothetical protein LXA43DRAFT_901670 [Ganoderma leucocontextum]